MNDEYTAQRLKRIIDNSDRRLEQVKSHFVINDIKVKEIGARADIRLEQLRYRNPKNYVRIEKVDN